MRTITNFTQLNQLLGEFISPPNTTHPYNLKRMSQLMSVLGNPQNRLKIVHVAGTSGKTSTAYYVASLLSAAGYKTGLTVSPHIDGVNERAQINMRPLPEAEFCNQFTDFMKIVDNSKIKPIYFELVIAFSLWLFQKRKVDYAVVEVGIGGLLDSTNILGRPDKICIITDIGLDHVETLGSTINQIATQKAGIIKPKNEAFIHPQSPEIMNVVRAQCEKTDARLHIVKNTILIPGLPLFQQRNFGLAYDVVGHILARDGREKLSDQAIQSVANIVIPARMEMINLAGKTLVLDGSHNEQKIQALVESMKNRFPDKKIHSLVSFGFVQSKHDSILASMKLLAQLGASVVVTDYTYSKASATSSDSRAKQLGKIAKQAGFESIVVEVNPKLAFKTFVDGISDVGLVTGSFYLMNPIREIVFPKIREGR